MIKISLTNVIVNLNNQELKDPFDFTIHFDCLFAIDKPLKWQLVYIADP